MLPSGIKARLKPSKSQTKIIITLVIFSIIICVLWEVKSLSWILWPFKIMTVALHEISHALMALCTGAELKRIVVNSNEGGHIVYVGGNSYLIIPAGYIGSTIFGGLLIFCGFSPTTSKIAAIFIILCMGGTLYYSNGFFTFVFTISVILVVGYILYIKKWNIIQYFVLFLGIMSGLYSLWDILEDVVKRRIENSDASQFAELPGTQWLPAQLWGFIWLMFSVLTVIMSVILAILVFNKKQDEYQVEDEWELLPTRRSLSNLTVSTDDNFGFGVI